MTQEPYDFRQPTPLSSAVRSPLTDWLPKACVAASKQWAGLFPFAVELEPAGLEVTTPAAVFEGLPESVLRFRATLAGSAEVTMLLLPRPILLALLGGLLGEPFDPEKPDRELTPIEEEVSDFIAREHFLGPLSHTWPLTPKLAMDAPTRLPAGTAPYLAGTLLVVARFKARGPFGEQEWSWLLPRSGWLDALAAGGARPALPLSREERESLVRELPVRMTVQLGLTHLSLVHLASLAEGDVLLLEQPVDQPLAASLGGQVKYRVWPGAIGTRQAVAIHSPVES